MKTKILIISVVTILFASCNSMQQMSSRTYDDIYYNPSEEVTKTKPGSPEVKKGNLEYSDLMKLHEESLAILNNDSLEIIDTVLYAAEEENLNPYDNILVTTHAEAMERRREASNNPWRGVSNYYFLLDDDALWYASAYDPAFYNIVVMGDEVWVEPNYISVGLGTSWGASYLNGYGNFGLYSGYGYGGYLGGYYGGYYPYSYYSPYSYWGYSSFYRPYYSPFYSSYYYQPSYYSHASLSNDTYVGRERFSNSASSFTTRRIEDGSLRTTRTGVTRLDGNNQNSRISRTANPTIDGANTTTRINRDNSAVTTDKVVRTQATRISRDNTSTRQINSTVRNTIESRFNSTNPESRTQTNSRTSTQPRVNLDNTNYSKPRTSTGYSKPNTSRYSTKPSTSRTNTINRSTTNSKPSSTVRTSGSSIRSSGTSTRSSSSSTRTNSSSSRSSSGSSSKSSGSSSGSSKRK